MEMPLIFRSNVRQVLITATYLAAVVKKESIIECLLGAINI